MYYIVLIFIIHHASEKLRLAPVFHNPLRSFIHILREIKAIFLVYDWIIITQIRI